MDLIAPHSMRPDIIFKAYQIERGRYAPFLCLKMVGVIQVRRKHYEKVSLWIDYWFIANAPAAIDKETIREADC